MTKWNSIFAKTPSTPTVSKQPTPPAAPAAKPAVKIKQETKEVFAFAKAPTVPSAAIKTVKPVEQPKAKVETETANPAVAKKRGRPSNSELQKKYEDIRKSQEEAKESALLLDPTRKLFSIGQRVSIEYEWGTKFYGNVLRHDFDSQFVIVEWDGGREGNIIQAAPAISLKEEELRARKPRKKRVMRKKKEVKETMVKSKAEKMVSKPSTSTVGVASTEKKKRGRPRKNPV